MSAGSAARVQHVPRPRHRPHMQRTVNRPLVTGELTAARRSIFAWTLGVGIHRLALAHHQLARRGPVARRDLLLRRHLHDDPQAPHRAEHRVGRHRRLLPGAHRLGGGHRLPRLAAGHPVRSRLPLDAAALLAAVDEVQGRVRRGRRADARRDVRRRRRWDCRSSCTRGRPSRARCCSSPSPAWACVYSASALVFGGWFIYEIAPPLQPRHARHRAVSPMRVFHASITYLTLLFVAIGIDPLLPF